MMSFLGKQRWGYIVLPVVFAVSFILLLTMSLPASATTYTITPEADAFVQSSRANNNYGTWTRFRTQGAPEIRSYLRFDVQGLDGSVNTAVLRLSVRSTNGAGIAVHQVADNSWGETSITYNNAPPVGSIINSSGAVTQSSWIEIDVSSYVTQDGEISLALVGLDNNVIDFDARETAKAPELVINTDSTPPPTADFSANPQAGTAPHTVNFTNQSTNADSYLWQFGDGITSTVENPVHTYVQTGTFSVVLTANGLGGSNIFTHTDYITVTTPVISSTHLFTPTADAFVAAPLPNSNWGDGDYLQTKVAPGFNSYLRFDVQNISDTIKSATLRIFTEDHESIGFDLHVVTDTLWTEMGITWNNAPPIGSVITSSGTITGGTWAIIDVTQFVTTTGEYNFALTSANDNATHYSSREGSHPPELIIDTSDESSPVFVDFYAVPISGTVPLSVNFHNLSENGTEYVWRFGNGITSTLGAPVYTYTQSGVYTVTLTGTGPGGEDT
ncbi:MAG: DNRLRE domain-containing protein, partial [Chloroflexi bacterium]|nr:DNRLRE domain-containing protein [Chloroflexota bacterium]